MTVRMNPSILPPSTALIPATGPVRPTAVHVARIVEWSDAATDAVRDADDGATSSEPDPVGAAEGPEVGIERPVLLHDHDDVPDLLDAAHGIPLWGASRSHTAAPRGHHGRECSCCQ